MSASEDRQRLNLVCRCIANGRRLLRQLSSAVRDCELTETEFRLMWLLRERWAADSLRGIEQKVLADELGVSPGQVSSIVESLRQRQLLNAVADDRDRRKQRWRLTALGLRVFEQVASKVAAASHAWTVPSWSIDSRPPAEDAA